MKKVFPVLAVVSFCLSVGMVVCCLYCRNSRACNANRLTPELIAEALNMKMFVVKTQQMLPGNSKVSLELVAAPDMVKRSASILLSNDLPADSTIKVIVYSQGNDYNFLVKTNFDTMWCNIPSPTAPANLVGNLSVTSGPERGAKLGDFLIRGVSANSGSAVTLAPSSNLNGAAWGVRLTAKP